jgi:hypothetical protein
VSKIKNFPLIFQFFQKYDPDLAKGIDPIQQRDILSDVSKFVQTDLMNNQELKDKCDINLFEKDTISSNKQIIKHIQTIVGRIFQEVEFERKQILFFLDEVNVASY